VSKVSPTVATIVAKTPPGLRRRRLPSVTVAARSQAFGSINVNYRTKTANVGSWP